MGEIKQRTLAKHRSEGSLKKGGSMHSVYFNSFQSLGSAIEHSVDYSLDQISQLTEE